MQTTGKVTVTPTVTVTDENFEREVGEAKGLVLVDFWASWCGPCRMIAPAVEQLAREYEGRVKVGKLDVDANPATAARFNVRSLPSLLLFRDGERIDTIVGAAPKSALEQRLQQYL